ncbi:MAG TPA: hypothetical protein PKH07_18355, partial [bacterium]|nr:hypothetical protein [bacterium]
AYLTSLPLDIFNRRQRYKYIRPGKGWANGVPTTLAIWVPRLFPNDGGPEQDVPYFQPEPSPVKWALWSVGPPGPLTFYDSSMRNIPVPRRNWYDPTNGTCSQGILPRLSTGHTAP